MIKIEKHARQQIETLPVGPLGVIHENDQRAFSVRYRMDDSPHQVVQSVRIVCVALSFTLVVARHNVTGQSNVTLILPAV